MGEPYRLTDKANLAFRSALAQELGRAGTIDAGFADKVLAGDQSARTALAHLLESGNPDNDIEEIIKSQGLSGEAADNLRFIHKKQFADQIGRGWTQKEIQELEAKNQRLRPGMLSRGGKQADRWFQNRRLIEQMLELEERHKSSPYAATAWQNQFAQEWLDNQDRSRGESPNWLESDENPLGWYMNNLGDPLMRAIEYGFSQGEDNAGFFESLKRANQQRRARNWANDADPVLPGNPVTPQEKEAALKALRKSLTDMSPHDYDHAHRREYGEYPSYVDATKVHVLRNVADIPSLATLGMAGAATAAGHGAKALGRMLGQEGLEEGFSQGVIGGGMVAGAEASGNSNIPWGTAWDKGNEARTDKYIPDPKTGEMRPETNDEFYDRDQREAAARHEARRDFSNMETVKPKAKTAFGPLSPLGGLLPW